MYLLNTDGVNAHLAPYWHQTH